MGKPRPRRREEVEDLERVEDGPDETTSEAADKVATLEEFKAVLDELKQTVFDEIANLKREVNDLKEKFEQGASRTVPVNLSELQGNLNALTERLERLERSLSAHRDTTQNAMDVAYNHINSLATRMAKLEEQHTRSTPEPVVAPANKAGASPSSSPRPPSTQSQPVEEEEDPIVTLRRGRRTAP